ncbi:MAG: hypothetical protein ACRDRS_07570 [Pseudonocardiaceae bacterium]
MRDHELLRGAASHGLIHGVLGIWLTTPNLEPRLEHSFKISRRGHRAEGVNVTVANDREGNPVLIFGSGCGWKDSGVLIVTGGHNTGGFAQAPMIAEVVLAALRGEWHPMYNLFI